MWVRAFHQLMKYESNGVLSYFAFIPLNWHQVSFFFPDFMLHHHGDVVQQPLNSGRYSFRERQNTNFPQNLANEYYRCFKAHIDMHTKRRALDTHIQMLKCKTHKQIQECRRREHFLFIHLIYSLIFTFICDAGWWPSLALSGCSPGTPFGTLPHSLD